LTVFPLCSYPATMWTVDDELRFTVLMGLRSGLKLCRRMRLARRGWWESEARQKLNDKRPIDRIRDAAGMMQVGTTDDASAIKETFAIGGVLHIIKEKGIYVCKLADQIDPARTNPNIPNVQQRVLFYGTDSPLVRQTLLTAKKLFNPSDLPDTIDCDKALLLALQSLHDLASMQDIVTVFTTARDKAVLEDRRDKDGSIVLSRVGETRFLSSS